MVAAVAVGDGVGVAVGAGVGLSVGAGVGLSVGVGDGVEVGEGVCVGLTSTAARSELPQAGRDRARRRERDTRANPRQQF